jgi:hypothetical protein
MLGTANVLQEMPNLEATFLPVAAESEIRNLKCKDKCPGIA